MTDYTSIWLRNCLDTVRLVREPTVAFSHELIHVQHPHWAHAKVYALESWYVPIVDRAIRRSKLLGGVTVPLATTAKPRPGVPLETR
jgi:hypothetical protein